MPTTDGTFADAFYKLRAASTCTPEDTLLFEKHWRQASRRVETVLNGAPDERGSALRALDRMLNGIFMRSVPAEHVTGDEYDALENVVEDALDRLLDELRG